MPVSPELEALMNLRRRIDLAQKRVDELRKERDQRIRNITRSDPTAKNVSDRAVAAAAGVTRSFVYQLKRGIR